MTRLRLYLAGIVIAAILGFGVYQCRNQKIVPLQVQQADKNDAQGQAHEFNAVNHDQQADSSTPELVRLRAEVARLRSSAAPALAVGAPDNPLVPVVAAQDRLIQAQDDQNTELTGARDEYRAAAQSYKAEAGNLRTALDHIPTFRPLAVGVLYGTDRSMGAWVEYDLGRVRIGADLVRRPLDIAGRTNIEGTVRLGWRLK